MSLLYANANANAHKSFNSWNFHRPRIPVPVNVTMARQVQGQTLSFGHTSNFRVIVSTLRKTCFHLCITLAANALPFPTPKASSVSCPTHTTRTDHDMLQSRYGQGWDSSDIYIFIVRHPDKERVPDHVHLHVPARQLGNKLYHSSSRD
jgi:hypothetical protein